MIQNPDIFEFVSYEIQPDKKTIDFNYKTRDLYFTEKIILPSPIPASINSVLLKSILDNLHLVLGITYFKMYCPKTLLRLIPYPKLKLTFGILSIQKDWGNFFIKTKLILGV